MTDGRLAEIVAYVLISGTVGTLATMRGRKRAQRIAAGDMTALKGIPVVTIRGAGANPVEDQALEAEAQRAACQSGFREAAEVYYNARKSCPDRVRSDYLDKKGDALISAHEKEKERVTDWVTIPLFCFIGIMIVLAFVHHYLYGNATHSSDPRSGLFSW